MVRRFRGSLSPRWQSCFSAVGLALVLIASAGAATTSAKFEPVAEVGGISLKLNGKGTRYRMMFKAYEMALYTPQRVSTSAELLALRGPKKLQFVAQRELPGTELGRLFIRGMADNATAQAMNRHTASTTRLIEVFSGKPKLMPGDTFAMEFIPGKGTTFFIQGVAQGGPVGDDEFFGLVLRIWFGESPADWLLRDAMLDGLHD